MTSNQMATQLFFPKDGNKNGTIERCEANISELIQDDFCDFLCGSEDFSVEHMGKKLQGLVEQNSRY